MIKKLINYLIQKPRILFLIDSLGALATALMLFFVLRNFHEYFGMPVQVLTVLTGIAVCFCIYSAACFFLLKTNWSGFIKVISYANLSYCILTLGLMVFYHTQLTFLGLTYFVTEIIIICCLVYVELKVVQGVKKL